MAFLPRAFSTSDLARSRPPPARPSDRVGVGELVDDRFLLVAAQAAELGDLDRDLLDLLGLELRHQLRRFLLGQAHQQDGGFADVGHRPWSRAILGPRTKLPAARSIREAGWLVESSCRAAQIDELATRLRSSSTRWARLRRVLLGRCRRR